MVVEEQISLQSIRLVQRTDTLAQLLCHIVLSEDSRIVNLVQDTADPTVIRNTVLPAFQLSVPGTRLCSVRQVRLKNVNLYFMDFKFETILPHLTLAICQAQPKLKLGQALLTKQDCGLNWIAEPEHITKL